MYLNTVLKLCFLRLRTNLYKSQNALSRGVRLCVIFISICDEIWSVIQFFLCCWCLPISILAESVWGEHILFWYVRTLSSVVSISNAVISLFSKENLCHHTEIRPDMEGFDFFTFIFLFSKMATGMNVYVRNTTKYGWKKQILTIMKKKEFIYFTVTSIVTTRPFPSFRRGVPIAVTRT